jgi:phosphate transport system permease protein
MIRRFLRGGEPFIWLTGMALAVSLLMIGGLLSLILWNGLPAFWPVDVVEFTFKDGSKALGQVRQHDLTENKSRLQLQVGNREIYGQDFRWIDEADVASRSTPAQAFLLERREWGNCYGFLVELRSGEQVIATGSSDETWTKALPLLARATGLWHQVYRIERVEIGDIAYRQEQIRLSLRRLELKGGADAERRSLEAELEELKKQFDERSTERSRLTAEMNRDSAIVRTAEGQTQHLPLAMIVRATRPNAIGPVGRCGVYFARLWEFIAGDPRESNTEGGILPAIFGTVMMVFIMTIAVVPLGVLAALYLREYAKQGFIVRLVRVAVNNLAGVPSIVFGVFGLGFFVYLVGGSIDRIFYPEALPTPTFGTGGILWASLTLALLTVPVVIVATEEGLAAVPQDIRNASLALGATKFETTWRVVLPSAMPGILTGVILAMARAAGEVAPLMITGVVKLAPNLPLDGHFPFLHLDRKFMHLGFHIYDVGFQSPNVEAARPMVYMTTILLLLMVVALNLVAILIRNHLRRKYRSSIF